MKALCCVILGLMLTAVAQAEPDWSQLVGYTCVAAKRVWDVKQNDTHTATFIELNDGAMFEVRDPLLLPPLSQTLCVVFARTVKIGDRDVNLFRLVVNDRVVEASMVRGPQRP